MQGLRRDGLDIFGRFTGRQCREDGHEVPPYRPPTDRHRYGRVNDEKEARQANDPPYETENHRPERSEAWRFERVFYKHGEGERGHRGADRRRRRTSPRERDQLC